jgi:predicted nucleic acid-binding protein
VAGADLVETLRAAGGAFVADTAPLILRTERRGQGDYVRACDPAFAAVESGELFCFVSTLTVAEFFVGVVRLGREAVAFADAYFRQPSLIVVPPDREVAQAAAWLVARGRLRRVADALIAATANDLGLPLLTTDRRLARAGAVEALHVSDFA